MKRIALRAGRTDISDFGSGYVSLYSKIPMKRYSVVTRTPFILRSDEWQQLRLLCWRLLAGLGQPNLDRDACDIRNGQSHSRSRFPLGLLSTAAITPLSISASPPSK